MATNRAIAATSTAIVGQLIAESQRDPKLPQCAVRLFDAERLLQPAEGAVIGVCLYRIGFSDVQPDPGLPVPDGPHLAHPMAVDLHYLVTASAADAATSQHLLGWAISVLNASPVLPPSVLNTSPDMDPVFEDGEAVVLVWEPLSLADLCDVWQVAAQRPALSATYVARAIRID